MDRAMPRGDCVRPPARTWMTRAMHQETQNHRMLLPKEKATLPAATVHMTKIIADRAGTESMTSDARILPTCVKA